MRIEIHSELRQYFSRSLENAAQQQSLEINPLSANYIVDVLSEFAMIQDEKRAELLPTLAWLYREATESAGHRRLQALRRLGDVSLFLSGFFHDYVRQTSNGTGYYIDMGCNAYRSAAHAANGSPVFVELAIKFPAIVNVLNSMALESLGSRLSIDELLDLYVRDSGNVSLHKKLQSYQLFPMAATKLLA